MTKVNGYRSFVDCEGIYFFGNINATGANYSANLAKIHSYFDPTWGGGLGKPICMPFVWYPWTGKYQPDISHNHSRQLFYGSLCDFSVSYKSELPFKSSFTNTYTALVKALMQRNEIKQQLSCAICENEQLKKTVDIHKSQIASINETYNEELLEQSKQANQVAVDLERALKDKQALELENKKLRIDLIHCNDQMAAARSAVKAQQRTISDLTTALNRHSKGHAKLVEQL